MLKYYAAAVLAVVFTGISQIFLKKGAEFGNRRSSYLYLYLNPYTITGYALFFGVTLLSLFALQRVYLKEMVFIMPLQYIIVTLLSRILLDEKLTRNQLIGTGIIVLGALVYNI